MNLNHQSFKASRAGSSIVGDLSMDVFSRINGWVEMLPGISFQPVPFLACAAEPSNHGVMHIA